MLHAIVTNESSLQQGSHTRPVGVFRESCLLGRLLRASTESFQISPQLGNNWRRSQR